jgi:hypothetical protein
VEVVSIRPPSVSPEMSPLRMRMDGVSALLLWCVLCHDLWCAPTWAQASGAKKLIYYGWGIRDTQYICEHWHEMEQMPFDGTGIIVAIDRQGWQVMCHLTVGRQGRGGACVRS